MRRNLLVLLVVAIAFTAIAAKPLKIQKVVKIMKDLDVSNNDDENGFDLDDNSWEGGNDWNDSDYPSEIDEDLVGLLILAQPNGYDLNVNAMILNRDGPWENNDDKRSFSDGFLSDLAFLSNPYNEQYYNDQYFKT